MGTCIGDKTGDTGKICFEDVVLGSVPPDSERSALLWEHQAAEGCSAPLPRLPRRLAGHAASAQAHPCLHRAPCRCMVAPWPTSVLLRLGTLWLARGVYIEQKQDILSSLAAAMLNGDLSHLLRASWMASLCCVMALCRSSCALSSGDLWAAAILPVITTGERSSQSARPVAYHHYDE